MREDELFAAYGRRSPGVILPDERIKYKPDLDSEKVRAHLTPDGVATLFWSHVVRLPGLNSCWVWKGTRRRDGYGLFAHPDGSQRLAHRFSFEMVHGPLGPLKACHDCDNPSCVRPDHLWAGTQADNMRDMRQKGRARGHPGEPFQTTREREFRARRRQALALSIPYVSPGSPQDIHSPTSTSPLVLSTDPSPRDDGC